MIQSDLFTPVTHTDTMRKLRRDKVDQLLTQSPDLGDNTTLLTFALWESMGYTIPVDLKLAIKHKLVPGFEGVARDRRRLKDKHPLSSEKEKKNFESMVEFRDEARTKPHWSTR